MCKSLRLGVPNKQINNSADQQINPTFAAK